MPLRQGTALYGRWQTQMARLLAASRRQRALLAPIGYLPTVKYEQQYYRRQDTPVSAARVNC